MSRMRVVVPLLVAALLAVPVATAGAHEKGHGGTNVAFAGGATTLALDPGAAEALTGLGLTVSPIREAQATDAGIAFPIRAGSLSLRTLTAAISHKGGLRIASDTTAVDLLRPRIVLDGGLFLTARVGEDGPRIKIADLRLAGVGVRLALPSLTLSNVGVELSDEAAAALNGAFGTDALAGGLKLGTASVTTSIAGISRR